MNCTRPSVNNKQHTQMVSSSSQEILIMLILKLFFPSFISTSIFQQKETTSWTLFALSTKEHTKPPLPHTGASDHLTIRLMPAYRHSECIDDVTYMKTITTRANRKPWLTGDVHRLLKARDKAFKAGDESGLKTARANLSNEIRKAKHD